MPLPKTERELIITLRHDGASVETTYPKHHRALQRMGLTPSRVDTVDGQEISWRYEIPPSWVRLPLKPKKVYDHQREAARRRMLKKHGKDVPGESQVD